MIKKIWCSFFILLLAFVFVSCGDKEESKKDVVLDEGYGLVDNTQDGTILHAWNWKLTTVKEKLNDIAASGYTSVQISPMQPQKDYTGEGTWNTQWWKLYQPLGFVVATKNHAIGVKDDLIDLCAEADKYGVKIIVDVVANHLAGESSTSFSPGVEEYEPTIYSQKLIHYYGPVSDLSAEAVVRGYLGSYPDLQTESPIVKARVLSLLKEYIDCGVSGFRFDAAKHIETPSDGDYASNFWPYVIGGATDYAKSLGKDTPYYYGEILNTPGKDRELSFYTDYMSLTDNKTGNTLRSAFNAKSVTLAKATEYKTGLAANKIVLWAESHDTYANDSQESTNVNMQVMKRTYAVVASRKDATSLFFVRPSSSTTIGAVGSSDWESIEVRAINHFHNYFSGAEEEIAVNGDIFSNYRYDDDRHGVMLVNDTGSAAEVSVDVDGMPSGTYTDEITGNEFVVKKGVMTGSIGSSGIAVVYQSNLAPRPIVTVSNDGNGFFYGTLDVTIQVNNTTNATYSIDGGAEVAFTGSTSITLGDGVEEGIFKLTVKASNEKFSTTKEYTYTKRNANDLFLSVSNIDTTYTTDMVVYAWVWKSGSAGRWVTGTFADDVFTFQITPNDTHFLLATFEDGVNPNWNLSPHQTTDVTITSESAYDGSTFTWTN